MPYHNMYYNSSLAKKFTKVCRSKKVKSAETIAALMKAVIDGHIQVASSEVKFTMKKK